MSLWNPYAFTPTGEPAATVAPPALRVLGGVATGQQLLHAQAAYYRFCVTARLSTVPNPTEQGYLPDGSRYNIVVVGPQATMTIWVAQSEDLRMSGIALALSNLDGSLLPEHSEGGFPITYLLTPHVKRGSRVSDGRWMIRKPPGLMGGKAVNASADGKTYFAGIDGRADGNIPIPRHQTDSGVNALAYDDDRYETVSPIYKGSRLVGLKRGGPLPFPYKNGSVRHSMQIVVRNEEFPVRFFLDLYVGPAATEVSSVVGDLVDTVQLPLGQSIDYQSITFSGDGTQARATGRVGTDFAGYDIGISPEGLSISIAHQFPPGRTTATEYWKTYRINASPDWGAPGSIYETWTIDGAEDFSGTDHPYGATFSSSINGPFPINSPVFGNAEYKLFGVGAYRFDRHGKPVNEVRPSRSASGSGYGETYSRSVYYTYTDNDGREQLAASSTIKRRASAQNIENGVVVFSYTDSYEWKSDGRGTSSVDGAGMAVSGQNGKSVIYKDDELDFEIYYNGRQLRRQAWDWVIIGPGGPPYQQLRPLESEDSTEVKVVCKGVTHLTRSVDFANNRRFQFFVASDPMTGALVVNLQDVHNETRVVYASWIYVVDSTGARELHRLMDIPDSENIRVFSNASLISV